MNSKNSSENIASSGDLSVQLTKTDIDHRIHEMKNKSSIESSTLYKTALFVVIGILIAFTSQCKLSLTSFIFSSFKVINRIRLLVERKNKNCFRSIMNQEEPSLSHSMVEDEWARLS